MKNLINLLFLFTCSLFSINAYATHNQAGNILFQQIGEKTIEATIHTYTKASSTAADRDSLYINWGDGTTEQIARTSYEFMPNDTKYNTYTVVHEYAAFGNYTLSMTDPNRNAGILNVNSPFSENVQFHLETTFELSPQMNSSSQLLEHPYYKAFVGIPFIHIPNPFDADGDSIAYELIEPMQEVNMPVPNYIFPNHTNGNTGGTFTIDETTGALVWDAPQAVGSYVAAMRINEYRNGQLVTSIVRDMVIDVHPSFTDNNPPIFTIANDDMEIQAGESIQFELLIEDMEADDVVVTASGGPFTTAIPATITLPTGPQATPLTVNFNWDTQTDMGREQPYQVVFTAVDNGTEQMMWQQSVFITVKPEPLSDDEPFNYMHTAVTPNPSNGLIDLRIHNQKLVNGQLEVFNMEGRPVFTKEFSGEKDITLDLQFLASGIYYFQIKKDTEISTGKLMIKKD